jgi:hypothetical protein
LEHKDEDEDGMEPIVLEDLKEEENIEDEEIF